MSDAKQILDLRLARGEISKVEYLDLIATIANAPEPHATRSNAPKQATPCYGPLAILDAQRDILYKKRCNAFVIDFLIGVSLFFLAVYFGSENHFDRTGFGVALIICSGSLYLLIKDIKGQSLGKRLYKIRVIHVPTRRYCGFVRGVCRNFLTWLWILAPFVVFAIVEINILPSLGISKQNGIRYLLLVGIAFPFINAERWRMRDDLFMRRRVDVWTSTQVILANDPTA